MATGGAAARGRQRESELEELLRSREDAVGRIEERLNQLSRTNVSLSEPDTRYEGSAVGSISREIGFSIKPDVFDGSAPLREFLTQFELIARANNWSDSAKTLTLASSLRGKARTILDSFFDAGELNLEQLKEKLEWRFGERHSTQAFYSQFSSRKQRPGEDLPSLGTELERLSRLAYPECSPVVRDKIACAQFIAALSDSFLKRTLQLENVSPLK